MARCTEHSETVPITYRVPRADETGLIEEAWWSGIVEPGAEWHALRHAGGAAAVAYRVRVTCQPNYYNSTCTTFCRPRDDKFGHYSCSASGDKRCLPGWHGDNCEHRMCRYLCPTFISMFCYVYGLLS